MSVCSTINKMPSTTFSESLIKFMGHAGGCDNGDDVYKTRDFIFLGLNERELCVPVSCN